MGGRRARLPAALAARPRVALPFAALLIAAALSASLPACGEREPAAGLPGPGLALPPSAPESVLTRLLLIGDAGLAGPGDPVLAVLRDWAAATPGRATVLFLGDLVYPDGMPPPGDRRRPAAERILGAQAAAVLAAGARAIFLPGNHDAAEPDPLAFARARAFVAARFACEGDAGGRLLFLPSPGEAGPAVVDLPGLRVVVLDTPGWLASLRRRSEHPPGLLPALTTALAGAGDRQVIVAGHHPPASHGPHGGYFPWRVRLFLLRELRPWLWAPTPVLGPLYAWARQAGLLRPQDLSAPAYRRLRAALAAAAAAAEATAGRPLAFAGGHDHALQVLAGGDTGFRWVLVSGAGSAARLEPVGWADDTGFALAAQGLMSLDLLRDGAVRLQVVLADGRVVFRAPLATGDFPQAAFRPHASSD